MRAATKPHSLSDSEPGVTLPLVRADVPFTLVIFGASGDLTARKLMPGLFAMFTEELFNQPFSIVGFARRDWDDARFRELMKAAIVEHTRVPVEESVLETFLRKVFYHKGDLTEPEVYARMKTRLEDTDTFPPNHVFYLAIKPDLFDEAIMELRSAGLVRDPHDTVSSRVVIEKPFGTDLESARALNGAILRNLDESQIYRIDHYLGKETVQNIMGVRFANSIFEPLFNNHHVDHIQITAGETVGMEGGRGGYYDTAGAVRDMMQNHILQLLCLVAMEPPTGLNADAIRNAKTELLRSVHVMSPDDVVANSVRAQYTAGEVGGAGVPGYREEERVDPNSTTPSYAAVRLEIDNWRWAGVPVFLRTGKRLARRVTEIVVQFKVPPMQLFQTVECEGDVCDLSRAEPNRLIFRIQPDEGVSMHVSAKRPAMQFVVESVAMDFTYSETWERSLPGAYERLLLDAIRGDSTLFTRSDEVEEAWRIVDPVLSAWAAPEDEIPVHTYAPGSWGPLEADRLIGPAPRAWWNPKS